jgi:hypothetical protein
MPGSPTWTTPVDYVDGQVITAAHLNTYIRDNETFLYQKGHQQASGSFPASPAAGDRCYRSDRNLDYYYDGTRWITTSEYAVTVTAQTTAAASTTTAPVVLPTTYAPYFSSAITSISVATTNSAGNVWSFAIQGVNDAQTTTTDLFSGDTSTYGVATFVVKNWTPGGTNSIATPVPTNKTYLRAFLFRNGTAGVITVSATVYYRQIG